VRPLPEGAADTYELVAGARRYRASKLARRESIPATVRELTDAQALELQVIENVQRVDVHPLDEAQGYAALIELQPDTYTVESISSRVGRSPAYVNGRLRVGRLLGVGKVTEEKLNHLQDLPLALRASAMAACASR
jgi:ParB family chromosome partitioning protein